jgi:flagellar protein FlaG
LNFSIDDATKSLVVKVIDSETEKVIRQIPPEEILAIRARIQELLGAIFDKEA